MLGQKLKVAVIFGGRSGEHEVSLMSAASVFKAADKAKYDLVPVGIAKDGSWLVGGDPLAALTGGRMQLAAQAAPSITEQPMPGALLPEPGRYALENSALSAVDVVFPVLHGPFGEDGTMQGLLELADIPYVGSGVAASAVGMDKSLMKAIFSDAGLPSVKFLPLKRRDFESNPAESCDQVEREIGYPCFVKPANLGSSVGISKARNRDQLVLALQEAAKYDRRLLVEAAAGDVREVEVSVLGNDQPAASVPGEIVPVHEFYDYNAKYKDDSELVIPARISRECAHQLQEMAKKAFVACDCAGLARVDFFVRKSDETILVNEINTMPGFTRISMYPKLWEASGLPYGALIDRLIELALERYADKARSKKSLD